MVKFDCTEEERELVDQIVERAMDADRNIIRDDLSMDLVATHANGCPLDFARLLTFDEFNFTHDIYGIIGRINRKTGELTGYFLPRCAKPKSKKGV